MNRRRSSPVEPPPQRDIDDALRPTFSRELARSRRHGHSVSVLVAPTAGELDDRRVLGTLEHHLRRYDVVGRHAGVIVVLAPDTDADEARALITRLDGLAPDAAATQLGFAVAPQEGEELDAVVQVALHRSLTSSGRVSYMALAETPLTTVLGEHPPPVLTSVPALVGTTGTIDGSALAQCDWLAHHRRHLEPPAAAYRAAKRALDVVVVLLVSVVALPVGLLCALAVKLDDPSGPVFFRQQRTGRGGRRITIHKFRSMCVDAEARKAELAELNLRDGPDFKVEHDPRITRVGRWLRKLSLDELPQLWDVLAGRMSLVGPRPTSMGPEVYQPWQLERFDAMPGLTGLWQVGGRTSTSFDDRVRLDISYCTRRSLRLDLAILLRTVPVVLLGKGSW